MPDVYTHPTEYAVLPKKWKVVNKRGVGQVVAAMLPYPVLHPEDAACSGDPAWVDDSVQYERFGEDTEVGAYMRATCQSCVLLTACREYGIAHEGSLMFGGLTPAERARIRKERRQALVDPHAAYVYGLDDNPHAYVMSAFRDDDDAEG
jgi:hypothetical protein